ncbi:PAS domain S-box protein [Robbsia andropogonis]|uniref:PAS domain S-box protein n=1 Tax=Robbsia andropogonis TaxID=28092 RepID=UPI003D1D473A
MTFALQDSDRLAMLQSLKTCILLHDAQSKDILWANAAACTALGFTVEELLPLKAPDMTRNEEKYRREVGRQWLDDAVQKGECIVQWPYRAKDGTEIFSEAVATRVTLHDRDVVMVQFRDIAAEERIKQDLRRLETRLKEFMQDLTEGIAVVDADGTIRYLSESARPLLGLRDDDPEPTNFFSLGAADDSLLLTRRLAQAAEGKTPPTFRYRAVVRDGSVRWHDATFRYVALDEEWSGILLHFRDVTSQVAEQEAARLNERALEYMARYNAMGEMAMTLSHELSQPLASARNFIEGGMLRLQAGTTPAPDVIWGMQNAMKQMERATSIIKSVRDYVVKLEQVVEDIDLNAVVNDVYYFLRLRAREEGVRIETRLDEHPLLVRCEKVLVGQVILNFAFNAMEVMRELKQKQRVVTLQTTRVGDRAQLTVSDLGTGLGPNVQSRIFDGFFTTKPSGNGLGLSVCKNIIARHDGDVWAEPHAPNGTTFGFSLPLKHGA